MRRQMTGAQDQNRWVGIILLFTILVFIICGYGLSHDIHTVIAHLLYIPVILACWRFPRPGLIFTAGIALGYLGLEYFIPGVHEVHIEAVLRSIIVIFIGFVVSSLSLHVRSQEESLSRLLSNIDSGVLLADKSGTILFANEYASHVFDRRDGSVQGAKITQYAKDPEEIGHFLTQCLSQKGNISSIELLLKRNDGFPVPVLLSGYSNEKEDLILTLTDLSEEKWMAHELATGKVVLKTLLDAIPEGVFLSDTRGQIIEVNKACKELTGWEEGSCLSDPGTAGWDGEAMELLKTTFSESVHSRTTSMIHLMVRVFEEERHYEVSLTPVPDDTNTITRIAGVIHDTTARVQYLKKIREREEYLNMVLDGLPLATVVIDTSHTVLSVNQALGMLFEREVDNLIGTGDYGHLLYPAGERPMLCDTMIEEDVDVSLENRYQGLYSPSPTVPGAYEVIDFYPHIGEMGRWIRSTAARLVNENGATIGAIETFEDFSSEKQAQDTIRISEERFKIASQIATDLIFEYDQESDRILWFGDIEKWLGLDSPGRVSSLTGWTTLIHGDDVGRIKASFIHHVLTGEPITEELRIKHRNGMYQTWVIKAVALYNENFKQIKTVGIVSDISEMRSIEEAKRKALVAIEKNIEQFAILGDHIRNPLQIIAGYNDLQKGDYAEKIAAQIHLVNQIVDQLDKGWIESESIRDFLRRHYGIADEPLETI